MNHSQFGRGLSWVSTSRHNRVIRLCLAAILSIAVLPAGAHAAILLVTTNPYAAVVGTLSIVVTVATPKQNRKRWVAIVDPVNLSDFQLDMSYDPMRMEFDEIEYVAPYSGEGLELPDLSVPGLVQDVQGHTDTPPPGEIDIFKAYFYDLQPTSTQPSQFTVFASSNDFLRALDTDSGTFLVAAPADIVSRTAWAAVPEPASLGMLMFAALTAPLVRIRAKRRAIKSERQKRLGIMVK